MVVDIGGKTKEKLIEKLLSKPSNFTYNEARSLLIKLGYVEYNGDGSRVTFYKLAPDTTHIIKLHKPHPGNELKKYAVKDLCNALKERGEI